MTTPEAAEQYLAEHLMTVLGRPIAVFNPKNLPVEQLPAIYGWNNGGEPGWYSAVLLAEDGTGMGGHICSDEGYMLHDLGILEGSRPDRHKTFQENYPDGYRMQWVPSDEVKTHPGLEAAYKLNQEKAETKDEA